MSSLDLGQISQLVLVAGLSGAGKSTTIDVLSDQGFYTIDNLPVALLSSFIDFSKNSGPRFTRAALLLDIDSEEKVKNLLSIYKTLPKEMIRIIFLASKTEMVIRRYSETRRPHPGFEADKDKTLGEAIERERSRLSPIKEIANFIIDSTELTVHDLKRELKLYIDTLLSTKSASISINFVSFGYKYGIPLDCDLLIDVRFITNPHFIDHLREKTGLDNDVREYVLENTDTVEFLSHYTQLLNFLLPRYAFEGKSYLNVGIGCTGGRHRSVTIAETLSKKIAVNNYSISVKHRDLDR